MLGLFTTNRKRMVKTILGNFSEDHFLWWLFFICELIFLNFFARFTLVPLKPLIKLSLFLSWILIIFHWHLSSKVTCRFMQQNQRSKMSKFEILKKLLYIYTFLIVADIIVWRVGRSRGFNGSVNHNLTY